MDGAGANEVASKEEVGTNKVGTEGRGCLSVMVTVSSGYARMNTVGLGMSTGARVRARIEMVKVGNERPSSNRHD